MGYALLELGVASAGIAATLAPGHAAGPFVLMQDHVGFLARTILFLLVGVPAFFMGGTLPVAVRSQITTSANIGKNGGWIYAANTAGGIAGALLVPFVLVPNLGVIGTAVAAAALNVIAAFLAYVLSCKSENGALTINREAVPINVLPIQSKVALILYTVAGGVALGYEVVWSQALAQFLSTRVFAFSVVLATYLGGLAIGSALYARFGHRFRDTWGVFGFFISTAGVIPSPAALLATYITDRKGLEHYVGDAPPVTDIEPRIEYSPWVRELEITRVLPKLLSLQSDPPLTNADDKLRREISVERQGLLDFYAAGIAAYKGDREFWYRAIDRVIARDSENPYYRWIIGGRR